jgi:hypothetical protein
METAMRRVTEIVLAAAVLAMAACTPAEQQQAEGTSSMRAALPDTLAASVWAHLTDADYAANWPLWPGKGELYTGTQPHGMLLTTYVNDLALGALTSKAGTMPAGAMVVKENYMPDSTLAAVTIMYKVGGYNAAFGDWFFVKRLADGTVEAQGRVAGCQGCHTQQADNDYLFTGSLSQ